MFWRPCAINASFPLFFFARILSGPRNTEANAVASKFSSPRDIRRPSPTISISRMTNWSNSYCCFPHRALACANASVRTALASAMHPGMALVERFRHFAVACLYSVCAFALAAL